MATLRPDKVEPTHRTHITGLTPGCSADECLGSFIFSGLTACGTM